jgi:hypothetical protein
MTCGSLDGFLVLEGVQITRVHGDRIVERLARLDATGLARLLALAARCP